MRSGSIQYCVIVLCFVNAHVPNKHFSARLVSIGRTAWTSLKVNPHARFVGSSCSASLMQLQICTSSLSFPDICNVLHIFTIRKLFYNVYVFVPAAPFPAEILWDPVVFALQILSNSSACQVPGLPGRFELLETKLSQQVGSKTVSAGSAMPLPCPIMLNPINEWRTEIRSLCLSLNDVCLSFSSVHALYSEFVES